MTNFTETITITFGDQAENHVGMEKIGTLAQDGFTYADLVEAKKKFEAAGCAKVELIKLNDSLPSDMKAEEDAYILVVREGIDTLLKGDGKTKDHMFTEQKTLDVDKKAFMYGRVVNKKARYNLCFAEYDQEPDYANGKGRIIDFKKLPVLQKVREGLVNFLGPKAKDLMGEGNYYYELNSCGIGWHGDAERRRVVGVRLGSTLPLHYNWFLKFNPIGTTIKLNINHGDLYVMSEKAVGSDWKKSSILTLRHAAGAQKFLELPQKKTKTANKPKIPKKITIVSKSNQPKIKIKPIKKCLPISDS